MKKPASLIGVFTAFAFLALVSPAASLADVIPPTTTADPAGGTYDAVMSVTLTADEPATIYYTTDGQEPTEGSPVYSGPVPVGDGISYPDTGVVELKYFAKDLAGNSEAVKTQTYNITPPVWTRQLGTTDVDSGYGAAIDGSGNVYVSGYTYAAIDGQSSAGAADMFVTKYDADGVKQWTRQLGTSSNDYGRGVAADSGGNVFVAGYTYGAIDGQSSAGSVDMFVTKYDTDGTKQWTRQLGTSSSDIGYAVATDASGNVYVAGYTYGAIDGQSGSGSSDMFVTKYDTDGFKQWTRQLGTSYVDAGYGVSADGAGNVCVAGYTDGSLDGQSSAGSSDMFVTRYDTDGAKQWTRQLGEPDYDGGYGVASDGDGNVYVAGETYGSLDGRSYAGVNDIFVAKYDPSGVRLWTKQPGSSGEEGCFGIAADGIGNVYLAGYTNGLLDGQPGAGDYEMFVMKAVEGVPDTTAPSSSITSPSDGATLSGTVYTITGTADDGAGSGVAVVDVSTNGGVSWSFANYSSGTWSYAWTLPPRGRFNIRSRATDNSGNAESPGPGVTVSVSSGIAGSPQLQHYDWDYTFSGACAGCHESPGSFLQADFRDRPGWCLSCHNASSVAHGSITLGTREHSMFVNASSAGRMPTYGLMTTGLYNNQPFARLDNGDVTCMTCHNPMEKYEDYGRSWEATATADRITYTLDNGPWAVLGRLVPRVYRTAVSMARPANSRTCEEYRVGPSEYAYNEYSGTITFTSAQPVTAKVYATLDYPYLRASDMANTLCSDCHTQQTHMGINCLACHSAHNTGNIKGVRGVVRAPDRVELPVTFMRYTGAASFSDGDSTHDGICEACHTQTLYHRRDGSGIAHHEGEDCSACHSHGSGFSL